MKGILVSIHTTAKFNFTDERGQLLGSVETQIPNELAMKLQLVKTVEKEIVKAVEQAEAQVTNEHAIAAAVASQGVQIRFGHNSLRSVSLVGKTPAAVREDIGDAFGLPKSPLMTRVNDRLVNPNAHVLQAGETLEFSVRPMTNSGQAMNRTVQALKKPIRHRGRGEIDLANLTIPQRNRQLQFDRNNGLSVRDLSKRYKISRARIYTLTTA